MLIVRVEYINGTFDIFGDIAQVSSNIGNNSGNIKLVFHDVSPGVTRPYFCVGHYDYSSIIVMTEEGKEITTITPGSLVA